MEKQRKYCNYCGNEFEGFEGCENENGIEFCSNECKVDFDISKKRTLMRLMNYSNLINR